MVGTIKKVYLNERNPVYSTYDVEFPDIIMCDMKHGWLEKYDFIIYYLHHLFRTIPFLHTLSCHSPF